MKKFLLAAALIAVSVSVHARALPVVPLAQAVKAPDAAEIRTRGRVAEDLGKNRFLIGEGDTRLEIKAGPDWYHTLPLKTGVSYTFDGVLKHKKDGARELRLVRVWRADGARLVVRRHAQDEPWKKIDKAHASAPFSLVWQPLQGAKP